MLEVADESTREGKAILVWLEHWKVITIIKALNTHAMLKFTFLPALHVGYYCYKI